MPANSPAVDDAQAAGVDEGFMDPGVISVLMAAAAERECLEERMRGVGGRGRVQGAIGAILQAAGMAPARNRTR